MNNYYQFINQISIPKQQFQVKTIPEVINFNANSNTYMNKIKCQTQLTDENKIEQHIKIFKDQSTQCDLTTLDQATQYDQLSEQEEQIIQLVESKVTYTNCLLSQMESIDMNNFQPRQAASIFQSIVYPSTLMTLIQENNNTIYEQLLVNQNQTFLNAISQLTNNKQINDIRNQIQQCLDMLILINKGLIDQHFRKDYSIVDQLSFNENCCEQQSPGWLLTPTIKIADSQNFSTDSLIINK
ncbi:unnamed protein product (macronuclear) [Paramecium tetraurelia]|uniref:Uncharacterized protein n=1 Tax=Paramecium tetraurelia TaxID=5888 RepID=A0D9R0_PARTE|nr:uncharacterized protein GSPATT00014708001 [Paramecium tetraurelia]CAK79777.1 unnamed protein product [Paramecium tetraurelia]|eukprot:XP_001447174.1 hypothetical protein (macronuclear) [Paramecium tetraurelia strain d4-2]